MLKASFDWHISVLDVPTLQVGLTLEVWARGLWGEIVGGPRSSSASENPLQYAILAQETFVRTPTLSPRSPLFAVGIGTFALSFSPTHTQAYWTLPPFLFSPACTSSSSFPSSLPPLLFLFILWHSSRNSQDDMNQGGMMGTQDGMRA